MTSCGHGYAGVPLPEWRTYVSGSDTGARQPCEFSRRPQWVSFVQARFTKQSILPTELAVPWRVRGNLSYTLLEEIEAEIPHHLKVAQEKQA